MTRLARAGSTTLVDCTPWSCCATAGRRRLTKSVFQGGQPGRDLSQCCQDVRHGVGTPRFYFRQADRHVLDGHQQRGHRVRALVPGEELLSCQLPLHICPQLHADERVKGVHRQAALVVERHAALSQQRAKLLGRNVDVGAVAEALCAQVSGKGLERERVALGVADQIVEKVGDVLCQVELRLVLRKDLEQRVQTVLNLLRYPALA